MDPNSYVGEKDVSRMRQSMIARKADITKAGGIDKIWNYEKDMKKVKIRWKKQKINYTKRKKNSMKKT